MFQADVFSKMVEQNFYEIPAKYFTEFIVKGYLRDVSACRIIVE